MCLSKMTKSNKCSLFQNIFFSPLPGLPFCTLLSIHALDTFLAELKNLAFLPSIPKWLTKIVYHIYEQYYLIIKKMVLPS